MGNCMFKGFGQVEEMVKVMTSSGGVMELFVPITAECITNEFPGHAIYLTHDLFAQPLPRNEELHAGRLYYLLPRNDSFAKQNDQNNNLDDAESKSNNSISISSSMNAPYRMSLDQQRMLKRTDAGVQTRNDSSGVWKVKLVISPDQLAEILAQEARTEALIESVRTVVKCGNGVSSSANPDQWSVSSGWKGSLGKYADDRW